MANQEDIFKKVISHAKEYGYVFQSSEIYDGLSAVYDYGQNGAELKKNIREYWWKAMVQLNENIVGIDAAIFMHPTTWIPKNDTGPTFSSKIMWPKLRPKSIRRLPKRKNVLEIALIKSSSWRPINVLWTIRKKPIVS